MQSRHILSTGLYRCYNDDGLPIDCRGTGQDAEFRPGIGWPENRFELIGGQLVRDRATQLVWMRNSCPTEFPMTWQEGLDFIQQLNQEGRFGRSDWRMPNRRELRSLIDHSRKKPALSDQHPFDNLFLGWFWSSTTAAIAPQYAWYVHLEGGRMFYGRKDDSYWVWPVCGTSAILAATGASSCFDAQGNTIACSATRQDGTLAMGVPWPKPRFISLDAGILDRLTGLTWHTGTKLFGQAVNWSGALANVSTYAQKTGQPWRLPTINELESLVDASTHSPALPAGHPFLDIKDGYWSSTTSCFETDWSYVLYLTKGAVGVGFKKTSNFAVWPVMSMAAKERDIPEL